MNKYYQPLLPYFEKLEISKQYQDRLWKKWFGYYKNCKNPKKKFTLIDQYNKIFTFGKERQ